MLEKFINLCNVQNACRLNLYFLQWFNNLARILLHACKSNEVEVSKKIAAAISQRHTYFAKKYPGNIFA